MFKYAVLATTAMLLAAPAFAQAVPVVVELEGPLEGYDHPSRTLTVMGMQVEVLNSTTMSSPTTTRQDAGVNNNQWFKGDKFAGRRQNGFLGGTAIVIGTWDPISQRVVAQDIFTEPAENVVLGVVTEASCSTTNCDGPNDYIRGNSAPGSTALDVIPGPAMIPIKHVDGSNLPDLRMPANTVKDDAGFELNLENANLLGMPFGAEGYFGDIPVDVPDGNGGIVSEKALHYFIWDIADLAPQLLLRKDEREIVALRTSCRPGDRFEMRGNIHSRVTPTGVLDDAIGPDNGVIVVVWNQGGTEVRRTATPTPLDAGSPYGGFRVRFDIPVCPPEVDVYWMANATVPVGNVINNNRRAKMAGVAVEIDAE
jgi:hypothetical protein